jgi:hypothetical protein
MSGGAASSALIYAPSGMVAFTGGGNFFGSVVGYQVKNTGGADIYYDRNLANTTFTIGNPLFQSFTWKKF